MASQLRFEIAALCSLLLSISTKLCLSLSVLAVDFLIQRFICIDREQRTNLLCEASGCCFPKQVRLAPDSS
jgi:hypothetical protein